MYNTRVPHINVMKKLLWEGIQLCEIFVGFLFLVGRVEASIVGGWCNVRKVGCLGAFILLLLIIWSHAFMYVSVWPHVDMVQ